MHFRDGGLRSRAVDECEALVVCGVPGMVVRLEGEALFVVSLVGQQCSAFSGVLADLFPQDVADAG